MPLTDEWERLCNEQDNAWREYIRAARIVRDKITSSEKTGDAGLTLADLAREHRAWGRVSQVRQALTTFVQQQTQQKSNTQRRSSR
jgi:hypothetical protein